MILSAVSIDFIREGILIWKSAATKAVCFFSFDEILYHGDQNEINVIHAKVRFGKKWLKM